MKTKKALSKRVKITGSGKITKRRPHQNHFNAKESGNATRSKRGSKTAPDSLTRNARHLLSNF